MKCANCHAESARVALNDLGLWVCADCSDPRRCDCGLVGKPIGIDRFAIGSADADDYNLNQCVAYRCAGGHTFGGPRHYGPGAIALLHVTSDRVAEMEDRVAKAVAAKIDAGGVIVAMRRDFGACDGVEVVELDLVEVSIDHALVEAFRRAKSECLGGPDGERYDDEVTTAALAIANAVVERT